jgi:hypothetical protein
MRQIISLVGLAGRRRRGWEVRAIMRLVVCEVERLVWQFLPADQRFSLAGLTWLRRNWDIRQGVWKVRAVMRQIVRGERFVQQLPWSGRFNAYT